MDEFLVWTWRISNLLAVVSIAVLICLIVGRFISSFRNEKIKEKQKKIRASIYRTMEDPKKLQRLVEKFARSDRAIAADIIIQLLDSVRGETRDDLLNVLRTVRADEFYIEQLKTGSVDKKVEAARHLALFDTDLVKDALFNACNDNHIDVRVKAVESLWDLKVRISLGRMLAILFSGPIENRRAVRLFFYQIASENAREMITELRKDDVDPRIRLSLISALGHSNNYDSIEVLQEIMTSSSNMDERARAMRSVGLLGHPMGAAALRLGLKDEHWQVVTQAAIAAGRIKDTSAITRLVSLLESDNWWLRFRSAEALQALGAKGIAALKKKAEHNAEAADIYSILEAQGEGGDVGLSSNIG